LQWTRNVATETGAKVPEWGFSSSPLVVDDLVVVAASGYLAGYEAASGKLRWKKESVGGSYSSPHLVTLDGVEQIVMLSASGATGLLPSDGKVLWSHAWKGFGMLQPAIADGHDILITTSTAGGGEGTRRIAIAQEANGWTAKEVWTSKGLKPYFNDLVVHKGHAFGFDGGILSCIDLSDGKRKWKGGRYGHGQMVLLVDQDLLLVLSEEGEVALVSATPDEFREVAKVPALHDKTWNHPAIVRDTLLVRNGEEMVAFRLPRQ
jgi:outer membrane protein assembly factor BamB